MELKRCINGHSYDPSVSPECPECAAQAGHTVPLVGVDMSNGPKWDTISATADVWGGTAPTSPTGGMSGIGPTVPVSGMGGVGPTVPAGGMGGVGPTVPAGGMGGWGWDANDNAGKTRPVQRETVPVNPQFNSWADTDYYRQKSTSFDQEGVTMFVDYQKQTGAIRPVTGWIVCVEGAEKGKDYRLHSDMNYIGRSRSNDVVLSADPTVSRERHAVIAYDNRSKMFFFAPAAGASLIRHNGRPVLNTVELKWGDRLEIGEGTYLFVPLCGESFEW